MSSFIDFARAHGVAIDASHLFASERIRRCPTVEHPRSKNGAYFWDGERGWCFAWDGDAQVQWWNDPNSKPWSEAEKQAWKAKREASASAQQQQYARTAQTAHATVRGCKTDYHDYLHFKGLPDCKGLVDDSGALIVPMRNVVTNALQGVQFVTWDCEARRWEKKMQYGMQARNAVFRMGPKTARETILCEGYATGLSIDIAARQMRLSASVVVCFSDRNMVNVAGQIKGKKYVYADNDKSGAGERAAVDAGVAYCMSETLGNDANDDHKRHGLMYVCKKLMEVRMRC